MINELTFLQINNNARTALMNDLEELKDLYIKHSELISDTIEKYRLAPNRNELISNELSVICTDCDYMYRKRFKSYLSTLDLTYKYKGVKLEHLYNRKKTYNGSDPQTAKNLLNATMFELIANYKLTMKLDRETRIFLCLCIIMKLSWNINNSITYNTLENEYILFDYKPITYSKIMEIIKELMRRLDNNELYVEFRSGSRHTFDIGSEIPFHTKRFTQEQLTEYINSYHNMYHDIPSVNALFLFINATAGTMIVNTKTNLKHYLKIYNMEHLVSIKKRRTKQEMEAYKLANKIKR